MRRPAAALLVALVAAGCVEQVVESRVQSALLDAGLGERTASCMAGRMTDRLSISQLHKLEELKRPSEARREASLADYLERVRRVGDAEVIAVTASSAALCRTGLAH